MSATVTGGVVTTPERAGAKAAVAQVPAVRTRGAALAFGDRVLWEGLDLDIAPGQFVAILGSNGSGKTSLLKVLLGEQQLTHGQAWIGGEPVRRGSTAVGYVPQRIAIDEGTMLKARDLVRMGLDGHRWGFPLGSGRSRWAVFIGSACALVATSAIAVLAGEAIARAVPPTLLKRVAGVAFVAIGAWVLWSSRSAS